LPSPTQLSIDIFRKHHNASLAKLQAANRHFKP
jgi:hypothetical protein